MTLRIEALQAITIRLPGGELHDLRPGEPITLPSELAVKLLSKAQGKVRLVDLKPGRLAIGVWVEFESPVLGPCTGQVAGILSRDDLVVAHHSVLKELTPIKAAWVVRVLPNGLVHVTEA